MYQVDSIALMHPFVSIVCYFKGNRDYSTTEPLLLQKTLRDPRYSGHTKHVFLSSSRLYALRACHFRGSVFL